MCGHAREMVGEGLGVTAALRLIAAIRVRMAVLESITANEESAMSLKHCLNNRGVT